MNLYHYYEKKTGPFRNLSDLGIKEAQDILKKLKQSNKTFASYRYDGYMKRRKELEELAHTMFIEKGGKPQREVPHYMVVEQCDWLKSWYIQGEFIKIPVSEFDPATISFTYGDMFPTFSPLVNDGKEYRNKLYTYPEILRLIRKYGLPQVWNPDGTYGPERYIEVQVWSDDPISAYRNPRKKSK